MLDKDNTFINNIRNKATKYVLLLVFAAQIFGSGCDDMNNPVKVMEQMEDRTVAEIKTEAPKQETRLSNNTIDENNKPDAVIGKFINESGDNLQYFIKNEDDKKIVYVNKDNELVAKISFDFEKTPRYDIEVGEKNLGTDDTKFNTYEILINNLREAGDIMLSNNTIDENARPNTKVGEFITEEGQKLKYSIPGKSPDFYINDKNELLTKRELDFETQPKYSLQIAEKNVETGETVEKNIEILVNDLREAGDIMLSNNTIDENAHPNTKVGAFITEEGQKLKYSIPGKSPDFYINDKNELLTKREFDFETQPKYSLQIAEKNVETGETVEKNIEILVNDLRELEDIKVLAPDNTENLSIEENREKGTIVGTFQDGEGQQIVGSGSNYFEVDGKNLVIKQSLNFEELIRQSRLTPNQEMEISVQEPKVEGQKVFTIKIVDVNEAPYDIQLSNNSFSSDDSIGTEFAEILSYDEDIEDTHTYRITKGHEFIGVNGGKLVKLQNLPSSEIDIEIEATDKGGLKWTKQFTITQTQPEPIIPPEEPQQPPEDPVPPQDDDDPDPPEDPPSDPDPNLPPGDWFN